MQLASLEHHAEHRRREQGAGELGQEEEPEVNRGVVRRQNARGQIGRGDQGGSRGQGNDDPRDEHMLVGMLRIVSSGRSLRY